MQKQRVLIIGYGKMGRIHAKHLDDLCIEWDYYDPYVEGGVELDVKKPYSHVIISTPTETHYQTYRNLDDFGGKILIEKPVIEVRNQLNILRDHRVFPGLVERYNPITQHLLRIAHPIDKMVFTRHSAIGTLADSGIHDIDLAFLTLESKDYEIQKADKHEVHARIGDTQVEFYWHQSHKKIRKVEVGEDVIDFYNQTFNGKKEHFFWPIEQELKAFLWGKWEDPEIGWLSHKFLVDCMDR